MKCTKCSKSISQEYRYCPFCSEPTSQLNSENNTINAGNNNINIGLGNNSKQKIYIDTFNVAKQEEKLIVKYAERYDGEVSGGVNGFKRKFEVAGILSIVSAVITIVGFWVHKQDLFIFLGMITLGLIIYSVDSKDKHNKLSKNGVVYSEGHKKRTPVLIEENDRVYKIRKYGICPVCGGKVNIYTDEKLKKKLGKCVNNSDHLYTYDHTIEEGVPFK
jgi:RNA polymerase subunit RPABC4/transcription elongation factor Spt4